MDTPSPCALWYEDLAKLQQGAAQTSTYAMRRDRLLRLKHTIKTYESRISKALYDDLKKSPEEAWITETGFVLAEIDHTLRHLKSWMQPRRVGTNLLNIGSRSYVYKEPLGLVLIISPWNYPFQLLFAPLVGALAAGNTVVLKPSELAPATETVMKEIVEHAFKKEEVLYVQGDGAQVIPSLMQNIRFDHIFFTGSTTVGKKIYKMAAAHLTPVTLELGGKSPCIIAAIANLKVAARRIALTKFSNAGQMCVTPDYILAHHSIKHAFIEELKKAIVRFFSDNPQASYEYGRIINRKQWERLTELLKDAHIVHGGQHDAADLYIAPTVIDEVSADSPLMQQEIFGPLLPVLSFQTDAEAAAIMAQHPDPLAFYVFTETNSVAETWLKNIRSGSACVNHCALQLTNPNLPFGGRGNSGIGRYHGQYGYDVFSHEKAVMQYNTWPDPSFKYPPFKGKLSLLKKFI